MPIPVRTVLLTLPLTIAGLLLATPAVSAATTFTWNGGGSSPDWSEGANWLGGVAPTASSSIGTLTFTLGPSQTTTNNDVSGLSVNALQVDDSQDYGVLGNGFTLGSGGLSINSSTGSGGSFSNTNFSIINPITLGSSQTWSVSGPATYSEWPAQNIAIRSVLTGPSSDLTVNLNSLTELGFGINVPEAPSVDDEIGNITITGSEVTIGDSPYKYRSRVVVAPNTKLNASDGHGLTLHHVDLEGGEAIGPITAEGSVITSSGTIGAIAANESHLELSGTTGPITATNSRLDLSGSSIGAVSAAATSIVPDGGISLPSVSLDGASTLNVAMSLKGSETYSQIMSAGNVNLGGATLALHVSEPEGCPAPHVGQVYTLISTTGNLSGTFGNAPDGSTVTADCTPAITEGLEPITYISPYRISYHTGSSPETVTATALPLSSSPTTTTQAPLSTTTQGNGTSEGNPDAGISAQQIRSSLAHQLVLSGKGAKIAALLKHGSYTMPFTALDSGTLSVQWFYAGQGARPARHGKVKPILVASGKVSFAAAGKGQVRLKLTVQGKHLLRHSKRVALMIRGSFMESDGVPPIRVTKYVQVK